MIKINVSFTDYRTRSINDDNLRIQAEVLNLYPNADVSEKDYSGLTITINGEKIDFYRKAFKYHVHSGNQWVKMKDGMLFKDAIMASLKQILEKEKQLINPEPKVAHIEPQMAETDKLIAMFQASAKERTELAKEQLDEYCDFKSKQGVQSCISHILKKREFIMQNQPDNKLAAFCLTLSDELK